MRVIPTKEVKLLEEKIRSNELILKRLTREKLNYKKYIVVFIKEQ